MKKLTSVAVVAGGTILYLQLLSVTWFWGVPGWGVPDLFWWMR